jgi:dsDNA-specific endonuclease/ATPase MutS2
MATETENELRRRVKGEGHLSVDHLNAHAQKLRDEMAELHGSDKKEREELKAQLDEVLAHIKEQKAAAAKEDEVKDSSSTMVVPPNDIPAQQPNVGTTAEPEVKKRLRWY